MADAVATQKINEGVRNLVIKLTNVSDGTGESNVNKVDVSGLTPAAKRVSIQRIKYTTDGMSVQLYWDATSNVLIANIPAGQEGEMDFTKFGGLQNTKATGYTGDVLLSTTGHTSADKYTIILEMHKHYD